MQPRALKILILSLFSTALLLSIVLGVHIYMVTEPFEENQHAQWQLHKINFERPISREEEQKVKSSLYTLEALERIHFNKTSTAAVLAVKHPSEIKVGDPQITERLPEDIQDIAFLHVPTEKELQAGCPINTNRSFPNQITGFIASVFKK
jgi:hypothetical protein